MKEPRENSADGPMQERRVEGVVKPERPAQTGPGQDTPDQQGIEIDHEKSRPRTKPN
jgi:hypothetical protein